MAAIDKIWIKRADYDEVIEWLKLIEPRFRDTFRNSKYSPVSMVRHIDVEGLKDDDEIPILSLPSILDRWIYQQPDCPECIKTCLLEFNYGGGEDYLLTEIEKEQPIYPKIELKSLKSPKYHTPLKMYFLDIRDPNGDTMFCYHMYDGSYLWTPFGELTADIVGSYEYSTTSLSVICGSWKSLLRRLRKWNLPPGCLINGSDRGGDNWKLKTKKKN